MPLLKKAISRWPLAVRKKSHYTNAQGPMPKAIFANAQSQKPKGGFTLIELIIVIAIIGIIGSIGFYGYQSSQQKARDAQRKNDLQQVKKALEAAKNDCLAGSYYPWIGGGGGSDKYISITNMLKNNGYLASSPQDPKFINPGEVPKYWYIETTGQTPNVCKNSGVDIQGIRDYYLYAHLEITNDPDSAKSFTKCGLSPVAGDFAVCPD